MSPEKVYGRRAKGGNNSNTMEKGVEKEGWWLPETPAKPIQTRPQTARMIKTGSLVSSCLFSGGSNENGREGITEWDEDKEVINGKLISHEFHGYKNWDKDEVSESLRVDKGGTCAAGMAGSESMDPVESNLTNAVSLADGASDLLPQCDYVNINHGESGMSTPPSSSKKRKNNRRDLNDRSQKRPKKKVYWPKVIGQSKRTTRAKVFEESKTKKTYLSDTEAKPKHKSSMKTPKPSTPKQSTPGKKRHYVRRNPSCKLQLQLKFEIVENSVSLPDFKVEHGRFENISANNDLGCQYNMLQAYRKIRTLSCSCLVESKQFGANFPKMCKKKRIGRRRTPLRRLEERLIRFKLSIPSIKKGKRWKTFIKKKGGWSVFNSVSKGSTRKQVVNKEMKSLIKKFNSLKIDDGKKRGRKTSHNELVVYGESGDKLVPYKPPNDLGQVKVKLDDETLRVWNLLMDGKVHDQENDEKKRKYWEEERNIYQGRVETFLFRMHRILGNRRFSPWKGSVLDSVVGVFLTQNVSDHLSSSAFMSLAATFPIKTTSSEESNGDLATPDSQESVGSSVSFPVLTFDKEMEDGKVDETETQKTKDSSKLDNKGTENNSSLKKRKPDSPGMIFGKKKSAVAKKNMNQEEKEKELQEVEKEKQYWDTLRKIHTMSKRHIDHMDSVDWEAVRCAQTSEIAKAIAVRGQQNIIAGRIQALLNKLMEMNGGVDLEWLRHAPPREVKKFLLKVYGLGLKSVECIRLLALQHIAFPVDVNVGRIAVRLGWVPLEPLPESIQIHLLDKFPLMDIIQKYLWPRLCTLDQRTLYELHYQLITFGKVFCTKKEPNCNACPMKGECKHFASAFASAKLALPGPPAPDTRPTDDRIVVRSVVPADSFQYSTLASHSRSISIYEVNKSSTTEQQASKECEPIIEMPASPDPESTESVVEEKCVEEFCRDSDSEEIIIMKLNSQECMSKTHNYSSDESENDMEMLKALIPLAADAPKISVPKMKNVSRLRTERLVYELPDTHPLLVGRTKREPDDPSPYLLVIWTTGEFASSCESTKDSSQEENSKTVPGTLLIPCRTALEGRFPLNGTYFQVNEVFADHASSRHPINVPRRWLWRLERRVTYFGTSTSTILKGLSAKEIHDCFWRGFVCVRAIDAKTRAPRPLSYNFHLNTMAKLEKKKKEGVNEGKKKKNAGVNEGKKERKRLSK